MDNMKWFHDVYDQANNVILPAEACSVTAMCQALHICGYKFPKGSYHQEEDNLMDFILHDLEIIAYYKSFSMPEYQPFEIHDVLVAGTNKWMGKTVTQHVSLLEPADIIEYLKTGCCILFGGAYPYYNGKIINHITCCHGYNDSGIIRTDSWGEYKDLYKLRRPVRNSYMPWTDVMKYLKPIGQGTKWGDVVFPVKR